MFVLAYFAVTLFTSATLLFFVQPMIGKMILPKLGGTPAVWNTCMVFFQAVLLLGYGYTHFVSTRLAKRTQFVLQAAILLMPLAFLPFSLGAWNPPSDANPMISVLGILAIVVGVPFFVVSTSAPLLQKWFVLTDHPSAQDPYFLYGASNLGSMLALVLYPVFLEPLFDLSGQTTIWTVGYLGFVMMVLGCIAMLWTKAAPTLAAETPGAAPSVAVETAIAAAPRKRRMLPTSGESEPAPMESVPSEPVADDAITWPRRLRWIALAAVPSSLMLSCTTYMTTDIAAIPFFWVLPLALYLVTFILVFSRWPVVWTAPRSNPTPAQTQMGYLILALAGILILSGIFMHKFVPAYSDPLSLGLPHVLYAFAFLLFFAFWVVTCTGGPHDFVLYFQPCFLLFLVLKIVAHIGVPMSLEFMLHLVSFFFTTLMCHGELASDRPSSKHLTEFYLWMSVGGVVGGIFNALVAPLVFRIGLIEYPLAMILACFLRPNLATETTLFPGDSRKGKPTLLGYVLDIGLPLLLAGVAYASLMASEHFGYRSFFIAFPIVCVLSLAMRPFRFGLALLLVWGLYSILEYRVQPYVFRDRGFFGMVTVKQDVSDSGRKTNYLYHGGIDHGRQILDPERRETPTSYFHPLTGIGQVFMKLAWPNTPVPKTLIEFNDFGCPNWRLVTELVGAMGDPYAGLVAVQSEPYSVRAPTPYRQFMNTNWRLPTQLVGVANDPKSALVSLFSEPPVAVIGLGTGTLAAYAKTLQTVDIYEIDPLVYRLSRKESGEADPPFTYLLDAKARGANLNVILGDGRLQIEKAPDSWYHVICLDAFASDAIPVHLLTTEAVETYLKKLAPGGVLVFNATNRYVDITGVLRDIADHLGLECWYLSDWYRDLIPDKYGTDFVILRRNEDTIAKLATKSFSGGPSLPMRLDRDNYAKLLENMRLIYLHEHETRTRWEPWQSPKSQGGPRWTDRYSNLLGVLKLGP